MTARLTNDQRRLRTITEATWQTAVTDLATTHGWTWWHAPDNRPVTARSGRRYVQNTRAGFPDLVLWRDNRLLFVELKREGPAGVISPDQTRTLDGLARTSAEVYIWRPSDLGDVVAILGRTR